MWYQDMTQEEQEELRSETGVQRVWRWDGSHTHNLDDLDETLLVEGSEDSVDQLGRKLAVSDHQYQMVGESLWVLATYHS